MTKPEDRAGDHIARAVALDRFVPQIVDACFGARDVRLAAPSPSVRAPELLAPARADRDWRAAGSSSCRRRRRGTDSSVRCAAGPSPSRGRTAPAPDNGRTRPWSAACSGRDASYRGADTRRRATCRSCAKARPTPASCRDRSPTDAPRPPRPLPSGSRTRANQRCHASSFGNNCSQARPERGCVARTRPQRAHDAGSDRRLGDTGSQGGSFRWPRPPVLGSSRHRPSRTRCAARSRRPTGPGTAFRSRATRGPGRSSQNRARRTRSPSSTGTDTRARSAPCSRRDRWPRRISRAPPSRSGCIAASASHLEVHGESHGVTPRQHRPADEVRAAGGLRRVLARRAFRDAVVVEQVVDVEADAGRSVAPLERVADVQARDVVAVELDRVRLGRERAAGMRVEERRVETAVVVVQAERCRGSSAGAAARCRRTPDSCRTW